MMDSTKQVTKNSDRYEYGMNLFVKLSICFAVGANFSAILFNIILKVETGNLTIPLAH